MVCLFPRELRHRGRVCRSNNEKGPRHRRDPLTVVVFYSYLQRRASHFLASNPPRSSGLATPARAPAAPAPIAASVPRHNGSAEAAGGGVAQVDESGESVGGVDGPGPWPLVVGRWPSN